MVSELCRAWVFIGSFKSRYDLSKLETHTFEDKEGVKVQNPIIYADSEELVAAVTDARGCIRAAITKLNRSFIESAFYLLLIISFS